MTNGDFVRIEYVGKLESGEIFDLTDAELAKRENIFNPTARYVPVPLIIGTSMVVSGLDRALATMSAGEKKEVVVKPEEGFGQRNVSLVRTVHSKLFKRLPVPGQIVDFGNIRGRVQSVSGGRIRVDFNHPLAGKILKYDVRVKEKIEGSENQIKAVLEFFGAEGQIKLENGVANVEAKLPPQIKERISKLILDHVKGVEKVNFIEAFSKNAPQSKS